MSSNSEKTTKLKAILTERGLTIRDLSKLIADSNDGKTVTYYILLEIIDGRRQGYNLKTAKMIAKALNVTLNDIVD